MAEPYETWRNLKALRGSSESVFFPCRPNPSQPKHGRHDEMYRTAAKRMLLLRAPSGVSSNVRLRFPLIRFSTSVNSSQHPQTPNFSDPTLSSSTASSASSAASSSSNGSASSTAEEAPRHRSRRPTVEFEEEQACVLRASLPHVVRLGWTEASMIAGARAVGVSPSIIGSFPRKEAAFVEFFMDECLQRLIDRIDAGEDLRTMIPSERVSKLVRFRLEMQSPYISKWPQALSIQAQPMNVPTSFKQRAMLVDEIWHAVGDEASDIDWYVKRTVLGGVYWTTEIYMLTDSSPDFRDTWSFLDNRVKDAFDLKKTIQEATYLAEAVGAGMGSSLQGFVKRVLKDGR